MRFLIVTGPMRSGSSVTARILNNLGIVMGSQQAISQFPGWHDDCEDSELAAMLAAYYVGGTEPKPDGFGRYISRRLDQRELLRRLYGDSIAGIGVKSNLLTLYMPAFCEALRALDCEPVLLWVFRSSERMAQSLREASEEIVEPLRAEWLARMLALQARILAENRQLPSHLIRFERADEEYASWLAYLVGVPFTGTTRALRGVR